MWQILVSIFTWFSGFLIASVIARLAAFIVVAGLSQQFITWLSAAVVGDMSGAPSQWLAVLARLGLDDFLGIILGAFALAASLSWSFRPGRVGS